MYPADFRYSKDHEWVKVEGGTGTVGITDHAQSELGDVVYVELPKVGAKVTAGTVAGPVETVQAASGNCSPVSGEVTEINSDLVKKPELVNTDPYGAAWLFKVKLSAPEEVEKL